VSEATPFTDKRLTRVAITAVLVLFLTACTDKTAELQDASLAHAQQWFALADTGADGDENCHGLGLLKHPAVSCAQMLSFASKVDSASRQITGITPRDCFESVCGEFIEINFSARDQAGNEVTEMLLLKRDDGRMKTYLYRSNLLLSELGTENPANREEEKSPQQIAYDEVVARYPSLYTYPPCYGIRPSSSNLVGELMARDNMNVNAVDKRAQQCGATFCLALVGNKIATLCPASD
jgi:hypothetical protein